MVKYETKPAVEDHLRYCIQLKVVANFGGF
jgi:hypothetical protein